MHTLDEIKKEFIDHIYAIDKSKLNMLDLRTYADIVKIVDEIDRANKPDKWMDLMGAITSHGLGYPYSPVAIKEE